MVAGSIKFAVGGRDLKFPCPGMAVMRTTWKLANLALFMVDRRAPQLLKILLRPEPVA